MTRDPAFKPAGGATTAPARSTGEPTGAALCWAVHWVYPHANVLALAQGSTRVGRDPACDWVLDDELVSRHHATFVASGASCRIQDQGSSNGVFVDGERVLEQRLGDGSVVRCGGSVGVVVYAPDAALAPGTLATSEGAPYVGSGKLKRVVEHAKVLAPSADAVLILGESGSGKELVAELLHHASGRRGRYLALNCARFQPHLAASELFGHVRGAFSGAERDHVGAALAADGGTLFLDEVAELGLETQAQLLRFLASGEVTPVGSTRSTQAQTRIVAATHRDLRARSESGEFRHDLFYRLSVHTLELPPLRARKEDILGLFQHFAGRAGAGLSPGFVVELLRAPWPGNVRELKNFAVRLAALHGGESLWSHHLAETLQPTPAASTPALEPRELTSADWRALYEANGRNAAQLARATKLSPTTVKRYLERHGVKE